MRVFADKTMKKRCAVNIYGMVDGFNNCVTFVNMDVIVKYGELCYAY